MNARNGQNYQLMPEMAKKYKRMPEMAKIMINARNG